ncbi:MAG: hypothetical protein QGG50_04000, partial [Methanopyri archaeon]|nr:hypothetical protein [Methanopyri archaeon]
MRLSTWAVIALALFLVVTLSTACTNDDECNDEQTCEEVGGGDAECVDLECTACQEIGVHECVAKAGGICCEDVWYAGKECCAAADCEHFLCT